MNVNLNNDVENADNWVINAEISYETGKRVFNIYKNNELRCGPFDSFNDARIWLNHSSSYGWH